MNSAPEPVLVVGDSMLDVYWEGRVDRVSPEAPVPVVHVGRQFERPGGAANVACNIAAQGRPVVLATIVGDDEAGRRLCELLAMRGITVLATRDAQAPTTQKIRPVCRRQQLLRIDFEQPPASATVARLMDSVRPLWAQCRWAVLSDYAKGSLAECPALMAAARQAGCRVLVDPKGEDFERYRGAHVLKPNAAEARAIVGAWRDERDLVQRMHALREHLRVDHLLVTRGEEGLTLCSAGRRVVHVAAEVQEVYDVTGAGDTVMAALVHGLASGSDVESAARLANRAAGVAVGQFGTATVGLKALQGAATGLQQALP